MELSQINPNIQKTLFDRIDALNRQNDYDPLETKSNIPDAAVSEMLTKSVWVTATASVLDYKNDGSGGLTPDGNKLLRLSSAYQDKQPINKPLTSNVSLFTNDKDAIFRGHSGITSVTTDFKNASMQYVTINWTLWDNSQFAKFKNGFLKHGVYVSVEFGWSTPMVDQGTEIIDAEDMSSLFSKQQEQMVERGGNYYVATGRITDFSFSLGQNGEYKCTTKLVAMGNDMFNAQIENDPEKRPVKLKFNKDQDVEGAYLSANVYFESFMKSLDQQIKIEYESGVKNVYHNGDTGWCSWGWFEDRVLNTFFGFTGKMVENVDKPTGEVNTMVTRIRSLIPEQMIILEQDTTKIEYTGKIESTLCRNHPNLKTVGLDIVLPGKIDKIKDIEELVTQENGFPSDTIQKYKKVSKTYSDINKLFDKFKKDTEKGYIRNIVFSSAFLNSSFGSGISNLKDALEMHWNNVSANFNSFWNFQIISNIRKQQDLIVYESKEPGGLKVQDVNAFLEESNMSNKDNPRKTFVFSVYGKDSLIKDFNLNVRMTSAMATMAALHSNKSGTGADTDTKLPNPEKDSMIALGYLNKKGENIGEGIEVEKDQVLQELVFPFQIGKGAQTFSQGDDKDLNIGYMNPKQLDAMVSPENNDENIEVYAKKLNTISTNEQIVSEMGVPEFYPTNKESVLLYDTDGNMLDAYRKVLQSKLTLIAPEGNATYDPIVPISITFTIPGIGGIMPFDVFQVDYLPEIYTNFSIFQVKTVSHNVSPQGWSTSIEAIMRVDMRSLVKRYPLTKDKETKKKLKEFNALDYVKAVNNIENAKKKDDKPEDSDKEGGSWWNPFD